MGKSSSAPSPDPRIGQAALKQAQLGEEWLGFAREQFEIGNERQKKFDAITGEVGAEQLEMMRRANDWSVSDRQRYEEQFRPIEDRMVQDAQTYDSPERQAALAAEAKADVMSNAQQAREQTQRQMASMGLDPRSGRFQGIDRASEIQTGLAAAGAQNRARSQVRREGRALRADVANMGRGLPSQAAAGAGLGLSAGGAAVNTNQASNANFYANQGIMGQGYGGAMQGQAGMASGLNQQYQNEMQTWNAQNQASGALWQGVGQLGMSAATLAMMSSKKAKQNKKPVKKGKALAAVKGLDVESWDYKPGMGDGGSHIGPYAEDFKRETGKGDGKTINVVDALGVTMKAIQDLDDKVEAMSGGKRRRPLTINSSAEEVA